MKQSIIMTAITALLLGLAGCVTMQDSSALTRQQEDMLLLREDLNRTQGKLETLEMEYQRLAALQGSTTDVRGEASSNQARLTEIERRLAAIEEARVRDRQAIVEQLSGKMAEIIGGGTAVKARGPVASAPANANATGYEHVVKEGETLSAIAAAYKVKTGAIIEANRLQNPDMLIKGQKLFIPRP